MTPGNTHIVIFHAQCGLFDCNTKQHWTEKLQQHHQPPSPLIPLRSFPWPPSHIKWWQDAYKYVSEWRWFRAACRSRTLSTTMNVKSAWVNSTARWSTIINATTFILLWKPAAALNNLCVVQEKREWNEKWICRRASTKIINTNVNELQVSISGTRGASE